MSERKVPKIRFPGFTGEWESTKVCDVFRVTRGNVLAATETDSTFSEAKPYPVYSSQTKNNGLMGFYKDYLYEDAITWTTDGANAGTVNYRPGKFYCTNVCGVLLSDQGYANNMVAEALNSVAWRYVSRVGNPKLMNNVMSEIEVYLPDNIAEQQKIASLFTELDYNISICQSEIEKWKELKKGMLQKMFPKEGESVPKIRFPGFTDPWKHCKLSEISDFITKGATPTTYGYDWVNEGIPFFRNDAIKDNQFVYGDYSHISEVAHESLSRSEISGDDILVAITGDIGKVGIVPKSIKKANINQHMARVRIIRDAVPYFVYQSLAREEQQKIYQKIKTGLSMPQLSLEQIRETLILCPSIDEQTKIADVLYNLDNLITLHQHELDQWQTLKKALLQQMLV